MTDPESPKPPPMSIAEDKDAVQFDGLSLETILESRAAFERGEGVPLEDLRREFEQTRSEF